MKVAILFDGGWDTWEPKDVASVLDSAKEVQSALRTRGWETCLVPVRALQNLFQSKSHEASTKAHPPPG